MGSFAVKEESKDTTKDFSKDGKDGKDKDKSAAIFETQTVVEPQEPIAGIAENPHVWANTTYGNIFSF